ncbi:putative CocE/NonD family hydrolase [Chitinophaga terrae (ex Kim and Jung 2007)]|uniref:CocE/NonD family hydrolase n=1 Tax=Chitinophaga terrae (ex Kim and Jung 2007) TaxID=408074 RepID=UPI00278252DD|nr:CocE/NonD family hydrolase [Chitinophaga terrae (ex Kim and Jung 2007)]MDQ0108519.1 putative CocE/NonD family hydrolase [Chitinophaga terrae (ex Kim and Jung 2007)]
MRKWLLLACSILLVLPAVTKAVNQDSLWMRENYTKKEVYITMRDGVKLFTSIYLPKDKSTKHPILMTRTPYSCAPYGADNYRAWYKNHYINYLKEGYIMVTQDVRGTYMSEGKFVNVRPFNPKKGKKDIDEASDTYDTIDWLVKNLDGNNGNVGVFGISYPGFYSTMAALSNHPALKAVSPQAPVTDWFLGDDFHHNGAFFISDAFSFYTVFDHPHPKPTTESPAGISYYTHDNYKYYLETGPLSNFAKIVGDSVPFWQEMYAHPTYDSWWQARNVRNFVYNVKPAMLIVGGVFDAEDCFGAWNTYKAIEEKSPATNNRIVMGPWYHGQWASNDGTHLGNVRFGSNTSAYYASNIEIPFFNYYLKGKGNPPAIAEATIFFTGENKWKELPKWPPADMTPTPVYLQENGKLSFNKPTTANGFAEYTSDPAKPVPYTSDVHFNRTINYMTDDQRFAARRPDVAVFESEELTEDITLAGPVVADLLASTSTTDADFIVKVIDVFPNDFRYEEDAPSEHRRVPSSTYPMGGYQMLVRGEVMRGKFRNSFEKPEAFVPNQPTQVKFTMPDVAHTFRKGHRIMVQVQSTWFPLVDRNPQQFLDIYKATEKDFIKANIRIYNASNILLPVSRSDVR